MGPINGKTVYLIVVFSVLRVFNYELDLSSNRGFQWKAFLPNHSKVEIDILKNLH